MFKRTTFWIIALVVVAGLTTSCILDPKDTPEEKDQPIVTFKSLQERDDVLFNLELAYNERRILEYDKLLDDAFIFYFDDADYSTNKTPVQWDRTTEVNANANMFDQNYQGDLRAITIDLELTYPAGEWTEEPENEVHPGESWYRKIVDYDLVIVTEGGMEYRALKLQAQFTIRWDDTKKLWQLRMWHDLGEG